MTYKELYEKIERDGKMPGYGLCQSIELYCGGRKKRWFQYWMMPKPIMDTFRDPHTYWGSGLKYAPLYYRATPLRLNLLLLMAAKNNEL